MCGVGTVMGSKNLKLIVAKGKGSVRVADAERFLKNGETIPRKVQGFRCGIFSKIWDVRDF